MKLKKFIATTLSASILLSPALSSGSTLFAAEPGKEFEMKQLESYPGIMEGGLLLSKDDIYTQPINSDFLKSVVDIIERVCSGKVSQKDIKEFAYVGNVLLRHTSVAREMFFDRSTTVADLVQKYKDQDSCYLYDILFYVYWIVIRLHCSISFKADTDFSQTDPILFLQSFHKNTNSYWEIMRSSNFQNSVIAGLKIAECLENEVSVQSSLFKGLTDVVYKFLRNKGLYFDENIPNNIGLVFKRLYKTKHIPECKSKSGNIGYKFCLGGQGSLFILDRAHVLNQEQRKELKGIFEDILKTERTMISLEKFFVKQSFVFLDKDSGMIEASAVMAMPTQSIPEKVVTKKVVSVSNMSKMKMKDFLSPFKTDLQDKAEKCKLATENSKVVEEACKVAEEAYKSTKVAGKSVREIDKAVKEVRRVVAEAYQKVKDARRMVDKINQEVGEVRKVVKETRKAVKEAKEIETWIANAESEAANAVKIGKMLEQAAEATKQAAKHAEEEAKHAEEEAKHAVEAAEQAEEERKQEERKLKKEETRRKQQERKQKKEEEIRKFEYKKGIILKKATEAMEKAKYDREKDEEELKKMFETTEGKTKDVELKIEGKKGAYRLIYDSSLFENLRSKITSVETLKRKELAVMGVIRELWKSGPENLVSDKIINLNSLGEAQRELRAEYDNSVVKAYGGSASDFSLYKYPIDKVIQLVYYVNKVSKQIYVTDNTDHVDKN
ncbi:MAG: hypothetical protein ACI4PR_03415 [Acutalibacteraceae bacterium]